MAWQIKRGYPRFRKNYYVKTGMPRVRWQEEIKANKQEYLRDIYFRDI